MGRMGERKRKEVKERIETRVERDGELERGGGA